MSSPCSTELATVFEKVSLKTNNKTTTKTFLAVEPTKTTTKTEREKFSLESLMQALDAKITQGVHLNARGHVVEERQFTVKDLMDPRVVASTIDARPEMDQVTGFFRASGSTSTRTGVSRPKTKTKGLMAKASEEAVKAGMEAAAATPMAKRLSRVADTVESFFDKLQDVWNNRALRILVGSCIAAAGIKALYKILASERASRLLALARDFISNWTDRIMSIGPIREIANAINSFAISCGLADPPTVNVIEATPEMSSNQIMERFATVCSAFVAMLTVGKVAKHLSSMTRMLRDFSYVEKGVSSVKRSAEYFVGMMPLFIQNMVFNVFSVGFVQKEVKQVYDEHIIFTLRSITQGDGFWALAVNRDTWNNLMVRMVALKTHKTTGAINKLSDSLLREAYNNLKKLKPASAPRGGDACSIATGVFLFGPPGLGKTLFYSSFGALYSPNPIDAVWNVPASNDHDDGYLGQVVQAIDDFGCTDMPDDMRARFLTNILTLTSYSVTLIKAADLSQKGTVNNGEYLFVTTNLQQSVFSNMFKEPRAFERRVYSKKHVVIEFVPSPSVCTEDGRFLPSKVSAMSPTQLANDEHVIYRLWRDDGKGRLRSEDLLNRDDAFEVILQSRKLCLAESKAHADSARALWAPEGPCMRAVQMVEKEHKATFERVDSFGDGKLYPVIPVAYRSAYTAALSSAVEQKVWYTAMELKGKATPAAPSSEAKQSFGSLGEFADFETLGSEIPEDKESLLTLLRGTGYTSTIANMQGKKLVEADIKRATEMSFGQHARRVMVKVHESCACFVQQVRNGIAAFAGMDASTIGACVLGGAMILTVLLGKEDTVRDQFAAFKAEALKKYRSVVDWTTPGDDHEKIVVIMDSESFGVISANPESIRPKVLRNRATAPKTSFQRTSTIMAKTEMQKKQTSFLENPSNLGRAAVVARNTVKLTTRCGEACGTYLAANVMVSNVHSFSTVSTTRGGRPFCLPPQDYTVMTNNTAGRTMHTVAQRFDPRSTFIQDVCDEDFKTVHGYYPISDVIYVLQPTSNGLPPFKSITNYFLKRSQWREAKGCDAYLVSYDGSITEVGPLSFIENKNWYAQAYEEKTGRLLSRAYHTGHDFIFLYPGANGRSGNQPGRCGQILCVNYRNQLWCVGIHAAQYGNTNFGMAIALDPSDMKQSVMTEPTQFVDAKSENIIPIFQSPSEERVAAESSLSFGTALTIGSLVKPGHIPRNSKYYASPLPHDIFPALSSSPYGIADLNVPMEVRLNQNYVNKRSNVLDWQLMGDCFDDTLERLGSVPACSIPYVASFSGFKHPLCPLRNLSPVDPSTSAGRRRAIPGLSGKKHCLVDCGDYYEPDARLLQDMANLEQACREGLSSESWMLFYKDEPLKLSKIEAKRTRVIRIPTLAYTLLCRSVFAGVLDRFFSRGPQSESAVGMNPESRDFDVFVRRLIDGGSYHGFIDADVVAMDDNHSWEVLSSLARAINRLFEDRENDQFRWNLFMSQFVRFEVIGGVLVLVKGAVPSGSVWTTFLNIVVGISQLKRSFCRSQRERGLLASLEFFHRCVRAGALGDDLIANVTQSLTPFSPPDFVKFASRCDAGRPLFEYTSGSKGGAPAWCSLDDVTFLSRNIRRGHISGIRGMDYYPVFSIKRVNKSLAWFRQGELCEQDLIAAKCNNVLLLLVGHGFPVFEEWRKRFVAAFSRLGVQERVRTWRDCTEIWDKPERALENFVLAYPENRNFIVAHPEMEFKQAQAMKTSSADGGIVIDEKQAAETVKVSVPIRVDNSHASVGEKSLDFPTMASRDQNVGTFSWGSADAEGDILVRLSIPDDVIVGTHRSPFSQFKQVSSAICNITVRTQGNPTLAGCLIAYVVPLYSANVATRITDSKVTQTFLQHMMIRPQSADALTLEVPFYYYRDAFRIGDQPYAQVIIKVFNRLRVPNNERVTFNILSSFKNARFTLLNPLPSTAFENLVAKRSAFIARFKAKTKAYHRSKSSRSMTVKTEGSKRRFGKRAQRKAKTTIHARPEMLQTTGLNTAEDGEHSIVAAAMAPSVPVPLDGSIVDVNQLLKRMVPVARMAGSDVGDGSVLDVELGQLFNVENPTAGSMRSQLSFFGSMFAAMRGGIRIYVLTKAQNSQILFRQDGRLSSTDAKVLMGTESSDALFSTFGPWQLTNPHMGRHIMATSPWISINRFSVVPKLGVDQEPVNIGAFSVFTDSAGGETRIFAGFADTTRISIPVTVPRFSVRSFNVGGDKYPIGFGAYRIGEFIEFVHETGTTAISFSQATADRATTAKLQDGVTLAGLLASVRIPASRFTATQLRDFGFPIPTGDAVVIEPNMVSEITVDLGGLRGVPVNTILVFKSSSGFDYTRLTEHVILREPLPAVEGTGGAVYEMGRSAVIAPPFADTFLSELYGIDQNITPVVPVPDNFEFDVNPVNTFTATDGNVYGIVTNDGGTTWQAMPIDGLEPNLIDAKTEMLSTAAKVAGNVGRSIVEAIDVVGETARAVGLDNPNIGTSAETRVMVPPYLSNVNGVSFFNHMSLNGAPKTEAPSEEHFGVGDETSFERICRPTFLERVSFKTDSFSGLILAQGSLNCAPNVAKASLECSFQPLACGFLTSRFNTWRADCVVTVDFIIPTFTTFRIGFAALPGVFEIPSDITDISSTYVTYKQVSGAETTHSFVIPYQSDTKRKYVPNGPATLENSFGKWAIFLISSISVAEGTVDPNYEMNIHYGLKNVVLDNWGLRNDTLTPQPVDAPLAPSEARKTRIRKYALPKTKESARKTNDDFVRIL
ncbi:TPA_asm: polyprotein [Patiria miniata associated picornavirus 2]|nr:TPA_asm: polyprotein [Patiria miniata associated picornavirus 2]